MSNNEFTINDVRERLSNVRTVMVTSIDEVGTLSSRPVTMLDIDINGDVWFLVDAKASWVMPIDHAPINVAAADDDLWVSFAGRASVDRDKTRIDELMNRAVKAFFDSDADPVALRVATDQIEWWASEGTVRTALKVARASVTGGAANAGTSGTIDAH